MSEGPYLKIRKLNIKLRFPGEAIGLLAVVLLGGCMASDAIFNPQAVLLGALEFRSASNSFNGNDEGSEALWQEILDDKSHIENRMGEFDLLFEFSTELGVNTLDTLEFTFDGTDTTGLVITPTIAANGNTLSIHISPGLNGGRYGLRIDHIEDDMGRSNNEAIVRYFMATYSPDVSGDGLNDINDFLYFQDLFVTGDLASDFNMDGVLDILDFTAFQAQFASPPAWPYSAGGSTFPDLDW